MARHKTKKSFNWINCGWFWCPAY